MADFMAEVSALVLPDLIAQIFKAEGTAIFVNDFLLLVRLRLRKYRRFSAHNEVEFILERRRRRG